MTTTIGRDQYSQNIKKETNKMRVVVLSILALVTVASARPGEKYTDKFDGINLDEILENRRLLEAYVKCLLAQRKCTAEGKELRSHIKEALVNYCDKCTDTQRAATRQVIGHLINRESDYWSQLVGKYDPDHKYVARYETELRTVRT